MKAEQSWRTSRKGETLILAGAGVVSLLPFIAYHGLFARLFWFGDEFDLIDQMDRLGFWRWVWLVFAENFVPLFKALWGGAVLLSGGSYAVMIALVWLTHALNVALLGRLLRRCDLSWTAVLTALALFGLAPGNFETLAWSVQGSAILSVTFMLLALGSFIGGPFRGMSVAWVAASALSFSRGVLSGPLLALGCVWPAQGGFPEGSPRRGVRALAYLAPSAVVAVLIALLAGGNQRHMAGHGGEASVYALWYFCLNPFHRLLSVESWGWRTTALLGALKALLVAWALVRSTGRTRIVFLLLVAFDLGNAALLGIGRYHTGLPTAVASRYQYASLVAITPMVGFWFSRQCWRIPGAGLRGSFVSLVLLAAGGAMLRAWPAVLDPFTAWRGTDSRQILFVEPRPDPHSVPGIPGLEMDRAKALIAKYNLH